MRLKLFTLLAVTAVCSGQVTSIPSGAGVVGTPPYEATFSAVTSVSVTAATHGKGVNAVVEACYDNATPRNSIVFSTGYPTVAANGDVVVAWSGSKTGSCFISAGDSGGQGPTGATGATGAAGADGANISEIILPVTGCNASTATNMWDTPTGGGATAPTAACNDTGSIQRPTSSFSGSAVNGMEITFILPTGWTSSSTVALYIDYVATAASPTGNVEWDVSTVCRAVGESWDGSFNTAQTITDAQAAQYVINQATQSSLTMTGCAAGEHFTLRIERDGTNDSSNDAALILAVRLKRTA